MLVDVIELPYTSLTEPTTKLAIAKSELQDTFSHSNLRARLQASPFVILLLGSYLLFSFAWCGVWRDTWNA